MADSYRENVLSVLQSKQSAVDFDSLYHLYEYHHVFNIKKPGFLSDTVSYIHKCLNSAKQRLEGLVLLDLLVRQCTGEVFSDYVITWMDLLFKLLQSPNGVVVQSLVCFVMRSIMEAVPAFPEISRAVATHRIPQLLSILLSASHEWRESAVCCINTCIRNFPGVCGPFKTKIEALVFGELDQQHVGKDVVECYALLAACGGSGGHQGVKYTEAWTCQCDKVLGKLSATVGQLYKDVETDEFANTVTSSDDLPLTTLGDTEYELLAGRYKVLCTCLETLLSEEFPAVSQVPVSGMIQLICRTLSVNNKMLLARPTTDRIYLATFLPVVHQSALYLLKCLITSCKRLLLPYSHVLVSLLIQEQQWTQSSPATNSTARNYGQLRQTVYETLELWLKVVGSVTDVKTECAALTKSIVSDITPSSDSSKVKSNSAPEKTDPPPRKKKKGSRGYQDMTIHLVGQKKVERGVERSLTLSALEALYWLMTTVGTDLSVDTLKDIEGSIIGTLLEIQRSKHDIAFPYADAECRRALYKALLSCIITPHPTGPALSQCGVAFLRRGLQDPSVSVASYCVEALAVCDVLIHPRAPCLQSPNVSIVDRIPSILCPLNLTGSTAHESSESVTQNSLPDFQQNSLQSRVEKTTHTAVANHREDIQDNADMSVAALTPSLPKRMGNSETQPVVSMDVDEDSEVESSESDSDADVSKGHSETKSTGKESNCVIDIDTVAMDTNKDTYRQETKVVDRARTELTSDDPTPCGNIGMSSSGDAKSSEPHVLIIGEKGDNSCDVQVKDASLDSGHLSTDKVDSTVDVVEPGPGLSQQGTDLTEMLLTFVDADPDSD